MKLSDETYREIISMVMKQQHGSGKVFNFLVRLHQIEEEFKIDESVENTLDKIKEAAEPIEMQDLPSDEYLFYIGTGVANLNPAIEHLKMSEENDGIKVKIISSAAEGLIKQKSNRKAIKTLKSQLDLLEKL